MDERKHAEPLDGHLPNLQPVRVGDLAVHRRAHLRALQLEPSLVDCRLGLGNGGLFARRQRRMSVGRARLRVSQLRLGRTDFVERILIVGARREPPLEKGLLTIERIALDLQVGASAGDVRSSPGGLGPQLAGLKLRGRKLRLGLFQGHPEGRGIDSEQEIAAPDVVAVLHAHIDDRPVHLGADRNDVLLHGGIVRGNRALARKPVIDAAAEQQQGHQQHQQDSARPARALFNNGWVLGDRRDIRGSFHLGPFELLGFQLAH